jgi:proteasome lid subunit RPN8/RPN11
MSVTISSAHAAQIVADANANLGTEICGLLIGSADRVDRIQPAANIALDPARTFELDPAILFGALRRERAGEGAVVGHYHSHPGGDGAPSATDAAMIRHVGELWIIAAGGALSAWRANGENSFDRVALILA